jgi:hypothetical protein
MTENGTGAMFGYIEFLEKKVKKLKKKLKKKKKNVVER